MHLSSIKKPETEPAAMRAAAKIAVHMHDIESILVVAKNAKFQGRTKKLGLNAAAKLDFNTSPTWPDLIAHRVTGRDAPEQVTCSLNNLGLGNQFSATGSVVYRRAAGLPKPCTHKEKKMKKIWTAAFALTLFCGPALAQQFPKDFQGEWIAEGDEPSICKPGAFDRMESDAIMKVTARDTAQIESSCQLKGFKGQGFGANVRLSCAGEGNTWQMNEVWSVRKVAGRTLLITASAKDNRISILAKCE